MKTLINLALALAITASASAHTSALPHSHEGSQTNWLPAVAAVAALAALCFWLVRRVKAKSRQSER